MSLSQRLEIYSYQPGTNRLTHIEGTPPIDFGYDLNGNITSETGWTYVYDLSNQLYRAYQGTTLVGEYTYNGAGQRIKKVAQAETRIFHYDLQGHLIAETNQNGTMLAEYVYLGDQLLAMIKPGNLVYYFHNDHLGTPQVLTNDSQAIVWKAVYTPFGEAVPSIQIVENPFRFPGQYYDQETGLHYNYFRYYDPTTGRYVTPDPIGLDGGINLWAYTANNPTNWIDPFGLFQSPWYLMWVPGQHLFDLGMTSLENRQYSWAAAYFAGMLGEQVLTALTFGQGVAARGPSICELKGATNVSRSIDPNKLRHIFGEARHGLDPLVTEFGSETAAFEAIRKATQSAAGSANITGIFEIPVRVGSQTIIVRGRVIEGIVRIGTAFKP